MSERPEHIGFSEKTAPQQSLYLDDLFLGIKAMNPRFPKMVSAFPLDRNS